MIRTKLILVEGPPGSGKSGTAQRLAAAVAQAGKPCQCYLEWSEDHPIAIGDDLQLGQVIDTAILREADMLQHWQTFAETRQAEEGVTVMESRFWQTSVMLMYAAGHPLNGVLESNRQVCEVIQGMDPVLIYFVIDDLTTFTDNVIRIKEQEWKQADLPGTWAGHIYNALDRQPWAVSHGLRGLAGYCAFLEEWQSIAETLYDQLPFPKIKIRNPYLDWTSAMAQMQQFLALP